jgi:hypothetical protein
MRYGAHLTGRIPYGCVPYWRALHGYVPHWRVPHGPAPHRCVPHRRVLHGPTSHWAWCVLRLSDFSIWGFWEKVLIPNRTYVSVYLAASGLCHQSLLRESDAGGTSQLEK